MDRQLNPQPFRLRDDAPINRATPAWTTGEFLISKVQRPFSLSQTMVVSLGSFFPIFSQPTLQINYILKSKF